MILGEKPLSMTVPKEKMVAAVRRPRCRTWFGIITGASGGGARKQLIDEDGWENFHYRAKFLQDWTIMRGSSEGGRDCGGWT